MGERSSRGMVISSFSFFSFFVTFKTGQIRPPLGRVQHTFTSSASPMSTSSLTSMDSSTVSVTSLVFFSFFFSDLSLAMTIEW